MIVLTTLSHSLPATTPDLFLPVLRSVQAIGAGAGVGLLAVSANQSLLSLGFYFSSSASTPTVFLDAHAITYWSAIR